MIGSFSEFWWTGQRTRYAEVNQIASSPLVLRSSAILDCAVVMPDIFDAVLSVNPVIPGCG